MARKKLEAAPEIAAHDPRKTLSLAGHQTALATASRAIRAGRPPQGWLISGPPGVGKATFAFRIARYLLAFGATDRGAEDLSVPENDPASVQVSAGGHPGLLVLQRGINASTGSLLWTYPFSNAEPAPIVANGNVYVGLNSGNNSQGGVMAFHLPN